jgi:hypothetical protein
MVLMKTLFARPLLSSIPLLMVAGLCSGSGAWANELSNDISLGAASQVDALGYVSRDSSPWSWDAGYTFDRTVTPTAAGDISDITNEVLAGFNWQRDWEFGAGVAYSSTPSEYLSSVGPNVTVGYEWKFGPGPTHGASPEASVDGKKPTDAADPFRPSVGLDSKIAWLSYRESFPSTPKASKLGLFARPSNTAEEIASRSS